MLRREPAPVLKVKAWMSFINTISSCTALKSISYSITTTTELCLVCASMYTLTVREELVVRADPDE